MTMEAQFLHSGPAPAEPGSYLLWFELSEALAISVGRLGVVSLDSGHYVYAGSALGPGGLQARLRHHSGRSARPHWHIDYLSALEPPVDIFFAVGPERLECVWAQRLHRAGAAWAASGFGSSDCRSGCGAHLLRVLPGLAVPARPRPAGWKLSLLEGLLS